MNQHRILRLADVIQKIGLSRTTIYAKINSNSERYDPDFPRPFKIGNSAIAWTEESIDAWIKLKMNVSNYK